MNENDKHEMCDDKTATYLFTCKDCGSHELYVEHYFTQRQGSYWTSYVERGPLNIDSTDDHRVEYGNWDKPEEIESGHDESVELDDEEETEEAGVIDKDSHEFYVLCGGCDREIEFGWSHPARGGRIWPAECTDFNPWKCWPESRYREKWAERGWLRPQGRMNSAQF